MRVHYLVDGYNFLFRLSHDWQFDLRQKREALIQAFNEKVEELKLSITLVFDGADMPRGDYTRGHWKNVEVVYTHADLSADEYILHRLEQVKQAKLYTVITSDNGLKQKAKNLGASVIGVKEFVEILSNRKRKLKRGAPPASDTKNQIERLRKIFEERLKKYEEDL